MDASSDESLFEQALEGDDGALGILMDRHGNPLMLYVNGYVCDMDAAEDIMIDAFTKMMLKAPRLREGGFKPYLYRVTRNLALRHLRRHHSFLSLDLMETELEETLRVEDEILATEERQALHRCLEQVPDDYREALYLVYLEGMSYDEVGAVMHKTRKQVDNLVQRGKQVMRTLLLAEGVRLEVE